MFVIFKIYFRIFHNIHHTTSYEKNHIQRINEKEIHQIRNQECKPKNHYKK
jgi:hypothetical protein